MKNAALISYLMLFLCITPSLLAFESEVFDLYDFSKAETFKADLNLSIDQANDQYAKIEKEISIANKSEDILILEDQADYFENIANSLNATLEIFTKKETDYQVAIEQQDAVSAKLLAQDTAILVSNTQSEIGELKLKIEEVSQFLGVAEGVLDQDVQSSSVDQNNIASSNIQENDPLSDVEQEIKGVDFEEAEEKEEDKIIASLVDGFLEYVLTVYFSQWSGANLYISLPEFGYTLVRLIFDGADLDWSPLEFDLTQEDLKIETNMLEQQEELEISDAFNTFNKLQDYKVYFQTLIISYLNSGLSLSEKSWLDREGGSLNSLLYRIDKLDVSVLDQINSLLTTSRDNSLVKTLIDVFLVKEKFSWLVLDDSLVSAKKGNIIAISKLNLVKAMRTMQRLEGAFLAVIVRILDSGSLPSEDEKKAIIDQANVLNMLSYKIKNQDPQVFLDLADIDSQIQVAIDNQSETLLDEINVLRDLIAKYSS